VDIGMLRLIEKDDRLAFCCAHGRPLVSVDDARAIGRSILQPRSTTEIVNIAESIGRALAADIVSDTPLPRFDQSAMDGYAISSQSVKEGANLRVAGRITAGGSAESTMLVAGTAVRIFTGARIPPGADAVIPQEFVEHNSGYINLLRPPLRGENIRRCASDSRTGDVMVAAGTSMGPIEMGTAATLGLTEVCVFRKLRIGVLSTGTELRQLGKLLSAGQIYDSNKILLRGLLARPWIEFVDLGVCEDLPEKLATVVSEATSGIDLLITTGGASVGDEDHMADTVRQAGGEILVHGVAIKPGKPLMMGRVGGKPYFGLPGNPGAVFAIYLAVLSDLIRRSAGFKFMLGMQIPAIASFEWTSKPGRTVYLPATIGSYDAGSPMVDLVRGANSGNLGVLSNAQGFAVIHPSVGRVNRCDQIGWLAFR
jgi:molybdopterin molybdotransferase